MRTCFIAVVILSLALRAAALAPPLVAVPRAAADSFAFFFLMLTPFLFDWNYPKLGPNIHLDTKKRNIGGGEFIPRFLSTFLMLT